MVARLRLDFWHGIRYEYIIINEPWFLWTERNFFFSKQFLIKFKTIISKFIYYYWVIVRCIKIKFRLSIDIFNLKIDISYWKLIYLFIYQEVFEKWISYFDLYWNIVNYEIIYQKETISHHFEEGFFLLIYLLF